MLDPVALAWSGRVAESYALACAQAASDDPYAVGQALEAFAVLGSEHRVRADEQVRRILVEQAKGATSLSRRAFAAAMALDERVLEPMVSDLLASGAARWDLLRYAGELPSHRLALALASGWDRLPEELRDEALLTSCAMPCASAAENEAWGARALPWLVHLRESVRVAALIAVRTWGHRPALEIARALLEDESPEVRAEAARTVTHLARIQAECGLRS
jgi:hypothetical protein